MYSISIREQSEDFLWYLYISMRTIFQYEDSLDVSHDICISVMSLLIFVFQYEYTLNVSCDICFLVWGPILMSLVIFVFQYEYTLDVSCDICISVWEIILMSALWITVFQYKNNLDVSCDICVSVWGHTRWLPGDVYTVWLCDSLLLGLPSCCPLCPIKQCGRDQKWCFQALHDLPETIWQDCRKHRHLAGIETTHSHTPHTHACP